jgi:hypothetical protein
MKKVVLGMMALAISIASIAQDQDGRQKATAMVCKKSLGIKAEELLRT